MRKSLMRMTLRQLQIFNEVCDLRSYSRAADEMSLTQPAVSLQIRQLEELIGQPLFDYVGKKLYMTEAAEALQRASRDIFGRLESLDMQLSDMQGSLQGQLKLAVESSAKYFVPHLFAAFKRQHPEVNLQLTVVNRGQVIRRLSDNRDDLVIMSMVPQDMGLEFLPFLNNPIVAVAPPEHPLCKLDSLRLQDLEPHTLLVREADASLFQKIGITGPWTQPVVGEVLAGGAAEAAGLLAGDTVRSVDGAAVPDGQRLRALIRWATGPAGEAREQQWSVDRNGQRITLLVKPLPEKQGDVWVGRVGAYIGASPQMMTVRHGPVDGLLKGVVRTWEVSWLTLKMMGRMVIGEASIKNLSGPLTIADYAGKSASLGITSYILFLALISVSLGVLNLLPLPVLDGGHLMYYLFEGLTGRPVSDVWLERLQRGGVALMLLMMSLALYNDFARLMGVQ